MSANPEKILSRGIDEEEVERLLEQRELLDATELIAQIGHCQWDYRNNRLLSCSQGYARIFNMSADEIIELQSNWEQSLAQIHPDDRDSYLEAYYAQQEAGNYTVEYRIMRNDGETRWLREVGMLKYDDNRNVIDAFGIIQDITEKRNYEQNLQSAKDSLEVTVEQRTQQLNDTVSQLQQETRERTIVSSELENKNAELERFAYTASHDLKTPLVTIKGFVGLLNRDLDAGDLKRGAQDIEKINQAADTMGRLLEELLELSRIGRVVGDLVTCSLTSIARQAVQMAEARIFEMNAEVTIEEMPEVSVDRMRLVEVYQNLVDNALKFMGNQSSPKIHIGVSEKDGQRCFYVRDNGIGIAAEYHDLVFGLFERLSMDVDGTGVGLALVKRIIEVHGGDVWVESGGPDLGSTIFFTLPVS